MGHLPLQFGIGLLGLPLGLVDYLILRPAPLLAESSWQAVLGAALILLVSTAFLEEVIFRGLLQTSAGTVLGRWGPLYVSAVAAALHIGHLSVLHVGMVFFISVGFAWLVARTASLLGVTLAHGLMNIALYLALPFLVPLLGSSTP
jgi:membrane protease YdiL (CAAX protease family)